MPQTISQSRTGNAPLKTRKRKCNFLDRFTNNNISAHKSNWIDFKAYSMGEDGLFNLFVKTVNGEYKCKSEEIREIAFYKTGVTL